MKTVRYSTMLDSLLKGIYCTEACTKSSSLILPHFILLGWLLKRLHCLALLSLLFLVACGGGGGGGGGASPSLDGIDLNAEVEVIRSEDGDSVVVRFNITSSRIADNDINVTGFMISYTNIETGEMKSRNLSIADLNFRDNASLEGSYELDDISADFTYSVTLYIIDEEHGLQRIITSKPLSIDADTDRDGIADKDDEDDDNDAIPDTEDNCPTDANTDQLNTDNATGDTQGDACDTDDDGDGLLDTAAREMLTYNGKSCSLSADCDGDSVNDDTDNCPVVPNQDQQDTDNNNIGDLCEGDRDGDGYDNEDDNCPDTPNQDQLNTDNDELGDACDDDKDGDGYDNEDDNCPNIPNQDQLNTDSATGDTQGDACDADDDGDGLLDTAAQEMLTYNGRSCSLSADCDGDSVNDDTDNCPAAPNQDQLNTDSATGDTQGDACDTDDDGDTLPDTAAQEMLTYNGKSCSLSVDCDGDSVNDDTDNCPAVPNQDQLNTDSATGDTQGDACDTDDDGDTLPDTAAQEMLTYNGRTCSLSVDCDGDSVNDDTDNCPIIPNQDQLNTDSATGDTQGDACDDDKDGDGKNNDIDNCPIVANSDQEDVDDDGTGDACDTHDGRRDVFNENEHRGVTYSPIGGTSLLMLGDGSGGGSAGGLRAINGGAYNDDLAIGGAGGGNDDNMLGTDNADIIFGDGSGGGAGAPYNHGNPAVTKAGGAAGGGNDVINGSAGDDIIFGDGFKGSSSEGRDSTTTGNTHCGQYGVCAGGDGGYGGGGGGGANLRQPHNQGDATTEESGGRGGIGGGSGGNVYFKTASNNRIPGPLACGGNWRWATFFHKQVGVTTKCGAYGTFGGDALDTTYAGGRGASYDAARSGVDETGDCYEEGDLDECHVSAGGGAGLGAKGGAAPGSPTVGFNSKIQGVAGGDDPIQVNINEEFWGNVLHNINFDGHRDDNRIWGTNAQQQGAGNDIINGGQGSDFIITGGGQDTVVLNLHASGGSGSNDFDIDRVFDFDIGDINCDRDKIKIVRANSEGNAETVTVDNIVNLPWGILVYDGNDPYGDYVGIIVTDGLVRDDKTHKMAALFLYDHHKDGDGTKNRDQSEGDIKSCHFTN